MIRLQNEPKHSPHDQLKIDSLTACHAITAILSEVPDDKPYPLTQFIITTMTALNYSLMPGIIELLAGEPVKENPTQDTLRFTALFLHNMLLNGVDYKFSTTTIIEHTTREYAVRYEMLSDIGEKILKRLQDSLK